MTIKSSRILVVDDEPANIQVLTRILEREGYSEVRTVTDSREVLGLWESFEPDLMLLDLMMPHLDGFEIMERLATEGSGTNDDYRPILVLTADVTRRTRNRALSAGAKDFLTKPFDHDEVRLRIRNLLETRALHTALMESNHHLEQRVRERTADLRKSLRELQQMHADLHRSREETVRRLSIAAELRDDDTGRHIVRMARYTGLLAVAAGIHPDRAAEIELATQMHDIGKIGIPDEVLLKPGRFNDEERAVMERHPSIGYRVLSGSSSPLLETAAVISLSHHERPDGTGYPRRLVLDQIPLEARLAAIADVFDALTSDRVYRPALALEQVLEIMRRGRGSQFDADLLDLFISRIPEFLEARRVITDTGIPA